MTRRPGASPRRRRALHRGLVQPGRRRAWPACLRAERLAARERRRPGRRARARSPRWRRGSCPRFRTCRCSWTIWPSTGTAPSTGGLSSARTPGRAARGRAGRASAGSRSGAIDADGFIAESLGALRQRRLPAPARSAERRPAAGRPRRGPATSDHSSSSTSSAPPATWSPSLTCTRADDRLVGRDDRRLHLHRLEHDERLARLHAVALARRARG